MKQEDLDKLRVIYNNQHSPGMWVSIVDTPEGHGLICNGEGVAIGMWKEDSELVDAMHANFLELINTVEKLQRENTDLAMFISEAGIEIESLKLQVQHWREARRAAITAGELIKAELTSNDE